jgi:hypothetical protein
MDPPHALETRPVITTPSIHGLRPRRWLLDVVSSTCHDPCSRLAWGALDPMPDHHIEVMISPQV